MRRGIHAHPLQFRTAGEVFGLPLVKLMGSCLGLKRLGFAALVCLLLAPAWSAPHAGGEHTNARHTQAPATGFQLMARLQTAAHRLDYTGIFTYQHGQTMLSSQIAHIVDDTGERQRVEVLDGRTHREFLRHNNLVESLLPERRTVLVEEREADHFPGLFTGNANELAPYYAIEIEPEPGRVAGRLCRVAHIVPRDDLRWGYQLCVDLETDLLLKVQTLNAEGDVLEQVAFSEVHIGDAAERNLLQSRHDSDGWRRIKAGEPVDLSAAGWAISAPAGFRTISQLRRTLKHKKDVHQLVLSDGLAAISVFIERWQPERGDTASATEHGATSVYRSRRDDHWLTVLGEVPIKTVRAVAEAARYTPGTQTP